MNYRKKYDEIKELKARSRGFAFEKLINEIFDDCGALIKPSYKTIDQSQQIDGAIEINSRIFLLEAKWEKSKTLAASKLYSFIGKINSKLEGTLGVFISHNRLKENFVNALRDGLRQNCILIHGKENISEIVDGNLNLKDYILYCYREASTRNVVEVSALDFISIVPESAETKSSETTELNWSIIYNQLTDNSVLDGFIKLLQQYDNINKDVPKKLVNVLPHLSFDSNEKEKLNILIEKIQEEASNSFTKAIKNKLTGDYWHKYSTNQILNVISKGYNYNETDYSRIIKKITSNFIGNWDLENDVSRILDSMFDELEINNIKLIANKYLAIYIDDSRKSRFEQKQFAEKIFNYLVKEDDNLYKLFSSIVMEDLENFKKIESIWIKHGIETKESIKPNIVNKVLSKYKKIIKSENRNEIKTQLLENYDSL